MSSRAADPTSLRRRFGRLGGDRAMSQAVYVGGVRVARLFRLDGPGFRVAVDGLDSAPIEQFPNLWALNDQVIASAHKVEKALDADRRMALNRARFLSPEDVVAKDVLALQREAGVVGVAKPR